MKDQVREEVRINVYIQIYSYILDSTKVLISSRLFIHSCVSYNLYSCISAQNTRVCQNRVLTFVCFFVILSVVKCRVLIQKVSHIGYGMFPGSRTGGSGGGHGGSGGRGRGNAKVGLGHDSIYTPTDFGGSGGSGIHCGM